MMKQEREGVDSRRERYDRTGQDIIEEERIDGGMMSKTRGEVAEV